jgi:cell division septum initiation protein DivIVA
VENLARRWIELTRQIDDDTALLDDYEAENAWNEALWEERNEIETQLETETAAPALAGIALKLRAVAWHMNVENAECANHDGVRTNELDSNEKIIASALADAERIMGGAKT